MNWHINADELGVIILGVVMAAQIIGRAIPDDATGIAGAVRVVAKAIGLYVGTNGNFNATRNFRVDDGDYDDKLRD